MLRALVITKGLHLPWNQGEVVATRNFVEVLSEVYDEVLVLSLIDHARGFEDVWKPDFSNVKVVYANTLQNLAGMREFIQSLCDLHVVNISLLNLPKHLIAKAKRIYLYLYALKNVRAVSTIFRTMGILLSSSIYRKLRIITPSPMVYRVACKLHSNTFYVPTPLEVPTSLPRKDMSEMTVLCLAHADYVRFPVDKIVPAIVMLVREGYRFRVKIVFSQQAFKDYQLMLSLTRSILEKYGLSKVVAVTAKNLGENDKRVLFTKSHVFLYPALRESAIDPPLTVLEAMSYGLCVIATNAQSIPHILENRRGVLIRKHRLTVDLYEKLSMLLNSSELVKQCSAMAKRYIKVAHSSDVVVKMLEKLCR